MGGGCPDSRAMGIEQTVARTAIVPSHPPINSIDDGGYKNAKMIAFLLLGVPTKKIGSGGKSCTYRFPGHEPSEPLLLHLRMKVV